MSNEELAQRVRDGDQGAALELWEGVRRFVEMKAGKYARACGAGVSPDDLAQAGFFAVLDAAEIYDPDRGAGFLAALKYTLQKRFREVGGIRSSRRDALQYSSSMDEPAFSDDEGNPVVAQIEDEGAALAFAGVEYSDFMQHARRLIGSALSLLHPRAARVVRLYYLEGFTMAQAAQIAGYKSKQSASAAMLSAFYVLQHCSYTRELRECMEAFEEYRACFEAAGASSFHRYQQSGMSATEAGALLNL